MIRALDKWLWGYLKSIWQRPSRVAGPRHLIFCVADHFEPFRGGASRDTALAIVRRWCDEYPLMADALAGADGRPPPHTFFYPEEEADPECLAMLAGLCARGYGEVEIHLHHRHDTADGLRAKLESFRDRLHGEYGCLGTDGDGRIRYGFVHGNWALCNSRPDGDWCGVNDELTVLAETGCYADFTFPSAPSPTQPRTVNAIYRAHSTPDRPRSHDSGMPARCLPEPPTPVLQHSNTPASPPSPNGLLLVQGPLALDWRRRKAGILPRIENGAISAVNPPTSGRVALWCAQGIHVAGRPEWVFVKVYTHGGVTGNADVLLGEGARALYGCLRRLHDGDHWRVHPVTAREMSNVIRAAEDGASGNPGDFRDYEIAPPPCVLSHLRCSHRVPLP